MDALTLDQLHVLLTVADTGSFSAAARQLRRAQSAVSYAIANLERLLSIELFDRSTRTPTLTPAGQALLADARGIQAAIDLLAARAKAFSGGVEPRVAIAVDTMFPLPALVRAIAAFREQHAHVALSVRTESLGGVAQCVLDGTSAIGVATPLPQWPAELDPRPFATLRMVPVVAASHPLAKVRGVVPARLLHAHVQLVLSDRSTLTAGVDFGVMGTRTWRLADLATKHAFLLAGFGYGGMPMHAVADDLAAGRLVTLRPPEWEGVLPRLPLTLVTRAAEPPGPTTRALAEHLRRELGQEPHASVDLPVDPPRGGRRTVDGPRHRADTRTKKTAKPRAAQART